MKMALSLRYPIQSIFWTNHGYRAFYYGMLIIAGSVFLAVASQIAIPLQPVPITLQSFALLFIAMTYGWRLGAGTVLVYLLLGALGVQVFSGLSAGTGILFGATGGYLFGFLPAVVITGFLVERGWGANAFTAALAGILGLIVIFLAGLTVLSVYVGWKAAITTGLVVFLPGEAVKLLILAIVVPFFWKKNKEN